MDKFKNSNIIFWVVAVLWMALIFYSSAQVAEQSKELSNGVTKVVIETVERFAPDKVAQLDINKLHHLTRKNAHFFAYLLLAILVLNAMRRNNIYKVRWTLLICVLYAISDEVHQLFVPGRGGQIKDVLIDSAGTIVGIGLYLGFNKIKKKVMISR